MCGRCDAWPIIALTVKQLLNTHTEVLLCLCIDVTIILTTSGGGACGQEA